MSDPAGAVVSSAPLVLANTGTGAQYQAATSETGNYTFGQLPIGNYTLTVTVPGFKTYIRSNLNVQAASTIREDIILRCRYGCRIGDHHRGSVYATDGNSRSCDQRHQRSSELPADPRRGRPDGQFTRRAQSAGRCSVPDRRAVRGEFHRARKWRSEQHHGGQAWTDQDITNNTAGAAFQAQSTAFRRMPSRK